MFARDLSDKGETRPGPAHLVGPHLPRGPARLLTALLVLVLASSLSWNIPVYTQIPRGIARHPFFLDQILLFSCPFFTLAIRS
jgi:hypothetical protein